MEGPVKKRGFPFRKKIVEPEPETQEAREAREAAERLAAEKAARLEEIGTAWAQLGDRVRAALPSVADHRQPYYLSLVRQGREAEEQGKPLAAHCRALVEKGLAALADASRVSPGSTARASSASPLASLKARWDESTRVRAGALLARHARRLAPAEREAYLASLDALSSAPDKNAQNLRRKLVDRLLRADAYRRRGARLSGWTTATAPENIPAGPYNDFIALEQTVQRIAGIHPEWAAEFLDLYEGMGKIRSAYQSLLPAGKK
jgi:hypothetical protein